LASAKTAAKNALDLAKKPMTDADTDYQAEKANVANLEKTYNDEVAKKKETREKYFVENTHELLYGGGVAGTNTYK